jgi:surface protein
MFGKCYKLREIDTSNWDVHNVRSAAHMFSACELLRDNDEDN